MGEHGPIVNPNFKRDEPVHRERNNPLTEQGVEGFQHAFRVEEKSGKKPEGFLEDVGSEVAEVVEDVDEATDEQATAVPTTPPADPAAPPIPLPPSGGATAAPTAGPQIAPIAGKRKSGLKGVSLGGRRPV
jgi:hypothetical protein